MRQSGQYWIKIKWPAAVNGFTWIVASYAAGGNVWFAPRLNSADILEVDENPLVYIEPQYRKKEYTWPESKSFAYEDDRAEAICQCIRNFSEILQDIHQQLVISNQKR